MPTIVNVQVLPADIRNGDEVSRGRVATGENRTITRGKHKGHMEITLACDGDTTGDYVYATDSPVEVMRQVPTDAERAEYKTVEEAFTGLVRVVAARAALNRAAEQLHGDLDRLTANPGTGRVDICRDPRGKICPTCSKAWPAPPSRRYPNLEES